MTFSTLVSFPNSVPGHELDKLIKRAFIHLRHIAPFIACTTTRPDSTKEFLFEYKVLKSVEEAQGWADTVVIMDSTEGHFEDKHEEIGRVWWPSNTGHTVMELHLCPEPDSNNTKWTFA